ncbi:hypothetical protein ID866_13231, partial [Astraeus odoratus]
MSSGNKNAVPINWQEVPNKELGLDEADPEDVAMAKLQEKFRRKQVREAEEAKKRREAKEAKKRAREAEEAEKRAHEAEVQCREAAAIERQREAKRQEAERAKEAKKQQCAESEAGPSGAQGQEPKCMQCAKAGAVCIVGPGTKRKMACDRCSRNKEKCEWLVTEIGSARMTTLPWGGEKKKRMRRAWLIFDDDDDDDDDIVVTSTRKAGKSEPGVQETMAQVVDRRMGEVVEELRGLRKGVAAMAESNRDLTRVLYCGFQSVDTLVDEVQIFGAEGFLPKLAPESEPTEDELQETLREVEELQEEHLEWAMERLQM